MWTFLTFCLWFVIEFFEFRCVLRSRDGKCAGKKIFDGRSFYAHASFTKWRTGPKELFPYIVLLVVLENKFLSFKNT